MDEILWCDDSNETSSAVSLYGTICFSISVQNEIWDFLQRVIHSRICIRSGSILEIRYAVAGRKSSLVLQDPEVGKIRINRFV